MDNQIGIVMNTHAESPRNTWAGKHKSRDTFNLANNKLKEGRETG
jgi:hypothetical protein